MLTCDRWPDPFRPKIGSLLDKQFMLCQLKNSSFVLCDHDLTWPDFTWMYLYSAFKMNFSETVLVSELELMQLSNNLSVTYYLCLRWYMLHEVMFHYIMPWLGKNQFETFARWIYYISWLQFLRGWIFWSPITALFFEQSYDLFLKNEVFACMVSGRLYRLCESFALLYLWGTYGKPFLMLSMLHIP